MLMNKLEFWLMNNPFRSFVQKFEARRMRKMSDLKDGAVVLEIGCGQGVGTKLIAKHFNPKKIFAIDLDEKMIGRAKKKVQSKDVKFSVADASELPFNDGQFDAVFDFGIIHHIPNWRDCIKELYRVLKPGGQVTLEDLSIESFTNSLLGKILRRTLDHPYDDMYTRKEFYEAVKDVGFEVMAKRENFFLFNLVLRK